MSEKDNNKRNERGEEKELLLTVWNTQQQRKSSSVFVSTGQSEAQENKSVKHQLSDRAKPADDAFNATSNEASFY